MNGGIHLLSSNLCERMIVRNFIKTLIIRIKQVWEKSVDTQVYRFSIGKRFKLKCQKKSQWVSTGLFELLKLGDD